MGGFSFLFSDIKDYNSTKFQLNCIIIVLKFSQKLNIIRFSWYSQPLIHLKITVEVLNFIRKYSFHLSQTSSRCSRKNRYSNDTYTTILWRRSFNCFLQGLLTYQLYIKLPSQTSLKRFLFLFLIIFCTIKLFFEIFSSFVSVCLSMCYVWSVCKKNLFANVCFGLSKSPDP